jgi:hypothetical protein
MLKAIPLVVCVTLQIAVPITSHSDDKDRARELVARVREALGGDSKLNAIQSLEVSGKLRRVIQDQDVSGDLILEFLLPHRFKRTETMEFLGGAARVTRTSSLNGDEQWDEASSSGGAVIRIARPGGDSPDARAAQLQQSRAEMARYLLGFLLASTTTTPLELEYAGEAESPDGKAFVITAKGPSGFAATLFVDQTTSHPLMLSFRAPAPQVAMVRQAPAGGHGGGHAETQAAVNEAKEKAAAPPRQAEFQLSFGDYRSVDGVRLPHHITKSVDGQTSEEIEVTRYRINPPLKPEKFKK